MAALLELWLPILLSAAGVFVVSSILHMFLPIHSGDHGKMAGEAQVLEAMRAHGVNPGQYMFPCPDSKKDMASPETLAKYEQGPVGFVTILKNGMPNMGKHLSQWFLFSLLVSVFTAYVLSFSLKEGANYMDVFRLSGTVAFMGYGLGSVSDSIWKGVRWTVTGKFLFDGLVYALTTAGFFGWLAHA
jgi:hypothetical protein